MTLSSHLHHLKLPPPPHPTHRRVVGSFSLMMNHIYIGVLIAAAWTLRVEASCSAFHNIENANLRLHGLITGGTAVNEYNPDATDPFVLEHTPVMTANHDSAVVTVTIGTGSIEPKDSALVHPTVPGPDSSKVHFISTIYAVDQMGFVFAVRQFLPEDNAVAKMEVAVPLMVKTMTVYAMCNRHGLFQGATIPITATGREGYCSGSKKPCFSDNTAVHSFDTPCGVFDTLRADRFFRQQKIKNLDRAYREGDNVDPNMFPSMRIEKVDHLAIVLQTEPSMHNENEDFGFIDAAWIETEDGLVVAAAQYLPGDTFEFSMPLPATSQVGDGAEYVAFVYHSENGLFRSSGPKGFSLMSGIASRQAVDGCNRCIMRTCEIASSCDDAQAGKPLPFPGRPAKHQKFVEQNPQCIASVATPDPPCVLKVPGISVSPTAEPLRVTWFRQKGAYHFMLELDAWPTDDGKRWFGISFPSSAYAMDPAFAIIFKENYEGQAMHAATYDIKGKVHSQVMEDATLADKHGIMNMAASVVADTLGQRLHVEFMMKEDYFMNGGVPVTFAMSHSSEYDDVTLKTGEIFYHGPHNRAAYLIDFVNDQGQSIVQAKEQEMVCPDRYTPSSLALPRNMGSGQFSTYLCKHSDDALYGATVHWRYNPYTIRLSLAVESSDTLGWLGMGFRMAQQGHAMSPAYAVISESETEAAWFNIMNASRAGIVPYPSFAEYADSVWKMTRVNGLVTLHVEFSIPTEATALDVLVARDRQDLALGKHTEYNKRRFEIDVYPSFVPEEVPLPPPVPVPSPPTPGGTPPPAFEDCTQSTMPAYSCMIRMRDYDTMHDMTLHYKYVRTLNASENRLALFVVSENSGWLAVGFPTLSGHMSPAEAVIYRKRDVEQTESMEIGAVGYHISSTRRTGVVEDHANVLTKLGMSALLPPIGGVIVENGFTFLQVSIRLPLEDAKATPVNIARSKNNLELVSHDHDDAVALTINFDSHTVSRSVNTHPEKRERHGACMVAAFGFLFPLGVIAKHYGNDLGLGVKAYYIHLVFSCVGIVLVCYAFMVAAANFGDNYERDYGDHNQAGYFLFVAIIVQPLLGGASALVVKELQPKEPSILRTFHRIFGYCILLGALYQCFSGFEKMKKTVLGSESTRTTLEIMLVFAVIFYCCLVPFMEIRRRRAAAAKMAAASLRSSDTPATS